NYRRMFDWIHTSADAPIYALSKENTMNDMIDSQSTPKDPVTHPEVPDTPNPTEPEGYPDPPEADPYPVTEPPLTPDTEPIPGAPPDVYFR
ncbi:MAG: hypothetical protein ABL959_20390, partial [Pyrinomonadaceae bacterium]